MNAAFFEVNTSSVTLTKKETVQRGEKMVISRLLQKVLGGAALEAVMA